MDKSVLKKVSLIVCVFACVCVCFMYESNATAVFEALLMARPQSHLVDYDVKPWMQLVL